MAKKKKAVVLGVGAEKGLGAADAALGADAEDQCFGLPCHAFPC